jgi:hypothetical protein
MQVWQMELGGHGSMKDLCATMPRVSCSNNIKVIVQRLTGHCAASRAYSAAFW